MDVICWCFEARFLPPAAKGVICHEPKNRDEARKRCRIAALRAGTNHQILYKRHTEVLPGGDSLRCRSAALAGQGSNVIVYDKS